MSDNESGGMLIGAISDDQKIVMINDLTLPIKEDIQSRFQYIRSEKHNNLLKEKWLASNKTLMYFGEWHTHPQDDPIYSTQDYKNWKMLLNHSNTFTEDLLFLIAGRKHFKIWLGNRKNNKITLLFKGEFSEIDTKNN
ncbi:Mov34/MPN/PAD-1 family protein [Bacillus salipaludis]|uniref:Mov34/MPN/PAD-1 family protein n=1 Tax=Bacillus salipaludis TaxID=2547811 RepID=UPI0014046892|nr:Mov34/MPN/PAD-1 family protein [Bacillus salipaludis]